MGKPSDEERAEELREKIIGFGERSGRKSFYPELREQLSALKESEERFRAVFEGTAIGIAVVDLAGRLESTNRALQELLDQPDGALRGQPFLSFILAEDRASVSAYHEGVLRGTAAHTAHEVRLAPGHGRIVWVQLSASLTGGDGRVPAHLVVAIQDVTLRRRAEEALQFLSRASVQLASSLEVDETLRNVTELAVPFLGDLCVIWASDGDRDHEHRLVACGDPARKALAQELLAGRSSAAALGAHEGDEAPRLHPDASASLLAVEDDPSRLDGLRRLGLGSAITVPLVTRGRSVGTLLLATAGSGRRHGTFELEVAAEFGRRAARAMENASLLRDAQEASRLKDEFLAVVSHELRTPLTAILGWVGIILRGRTLDPDRTRDALRVVDRSGRALAQIIDDLLGVSRIMAGKLEVELAPTDLSAVLEGAIESLRPAASEHRVAIHVDCEPRIPPILGDARRLQQVVWNLVSNSVKYTPEGGEVRIRLERADGDARLTVRDTGCGIRPEFLPHVFDLFRQADGSTTRRHGGLGLGLTLVQRLVTLHGGAVRAESDGEGRGACFTVTLPLASGAVPSSRGRADAELPRVPDLRVLVVEDDPDTLEMLGEILERQGAHVVLASSARSALHELDLATPDLLISDIAMAGQDGIALIRAVRERGLRIPALAVSALSREEDRARAEAAGFDRYLVKPVDLRELLQAVASRSGRPSAAQPGG